MNITNCGNVEAGMIRTTETSSSYKWNNYVSTFSKEENITLVVNNEKAGIDKTLSMGFVQGPNDVLAIAKNVDNTFKITASKIETVSYYVVKVGIYSKSNAGKGTQMYEVQEKLDAKGNLDKTSIKYLAFTMENLQTKTTICGWTVVAKDGVEYYKFDKDGYTITNGTLPMVTVIAYDANGNVLSSATLKK